jgi:cytochrome c oxidase accessory protein FixG
MQDKDSIVIGYDRARGEPRGKRSVDPGAAASVGDCVDCRRCVQVCPTGIDIRNGLQMECIGCAACIDACDDVMTKLHRPKGLIRYDSERGLSGAQRRVLRPRLVGYAIVGAGLLAALSAFTFTSSPLVARVVRPAAVPWQFVERDGVRVVQSTMFVHVENRSSIARAISVSVALPAGIAASLPAPHATLEPQARTDIPLLTYAPASSLPATARVFVDDDDGAHTEVELRLLGPTR